MLHQFLATILIDEKSSFSGAHGARPDPRYSRFVQSESSSKSDGNVFLVIAITPQAKASVSESSAEGAILACFVMCVIQF